MMKTALFAGIAVAGLAAQAHADIVYDHLTSTTPGGISFCNEWNTTPRETASNMESPGGQENIAEAAQRLTLAGTARFITQLDASQWAFSAQGPGSGPCIADVTLALYTVNGNIPGSLLWSGTVTGVSMNPGNTTAAVPISFFPNVTVPNVVFLSISHSNIVNQRGFMGLSWNPNSVGIAGFGGPWADKDSTTGLWTQELPGTDGSMMVRMTAIPAPATLPLLGLGFAMQRRRRPFRS